MKKIFTAASILFLAVSLYAVTVIKSIQAYQQNGKVVIEWTTDNEQSVNAYTVQRSMNRGESWFDLGRVSPYGFSASYMFMDENILGGKSDLEYQYRLRIVYTDGSVAYSQPVTVMMTISSVQMTWGSIKAMFR